MQPENALPDDLDGPTGKKFTQPGSISATGRTGGISQELNMASGQTSASPDFLLLRHHVITFTL